MKQNTLISILVLGALIAHCVQCEQTSSRNLLQFFGNLEAFGGSSGGGSSTFSTPTFTISSPFTGGPPSTQAPAPVESDTGSSSGESDTSSAAASTAPFERDVSVTQAGSTSESSPAGDCELATSGLGVLNFGFNPSGGVSASGGATGTATGGCGNNALSGSAFTLFGRR